MAAVRFQTLIFDLDDTLIPTSEVLIPRAVQHVFQVLTSNGLDWNFEKFEQYRKKHMRKLSHREIIKEIIENLIPKNSMETKGHIFDSCLKAFYQASLPEVIPLLPGAQHNLEKLKSKYTLFLLTGGDLATQKQKLIKAGLQGFFQEIEVADASLNNAKKKIIEKWIAEKKINPLQSLSIGNRLSDEIRVSKILGLKTCHIQFGEHADELPEDNYEDADYKILHHAELIAKCQL